MKRLIILLCILEVALYVRSETCKIDPEPVNWLCDVNWIDRRRYINSLPPEKTIYVVTPTFPRSTQVAELTRLSHTLMHVPGIHWMLTDDANECFENIHNILKRSGLPYTYITSPNPYKDITHLSGIAGRRAALNWLRSNVKQGILYLTSDESVTDLELFEQIRYTKKVSMAPVGLVNDFGMSSPVIVDGKVVGFFDSWIGGREFPVSMQGMAVNIALLTRKTDIPYQAGQDEDNFLLSLGITLADIEPLASNCTEFLVWNTQTAHDEKRVLKVSEQFLKSQKSAENLLLLLKNASNQNMVELRLNSSGLLPYVTRNKEKSNDIYFIE